MSGAGGKLAISVTVRGSDFQLQTFAAGETPPAWARALITNPKAWETAPESSPTPKGEDEDAPTSDEDTPPTPEDTPPADAPENTDDPEEDLVGALPEPPKRGAGSGREPWAAYARSKGVTVVNDMSRDDIIDAVEALPSE